MNKIKRAVHFDFHTMPGIEDFASEFSASDFARTMSDTHVDYVNIFARCNIGFSYYPTKIGTAYPTMKGDWLGEIIEECHKRNIGVTAYLNGGLNHQLLVERPEFMRIYKDGRVYKEERVHANFFRTPCYNTGYRQHLLDEIKEILERNPDGIFCDCLATESCYCPTCVKMMKEQGIDIENDDAVFAFALESTRSLFKDIRNVVPEDKRLILNSHPTDDLEMYQSHIEVECLPTDPMWGYDFLPAIAPYYRKFKDELIYMNGRFVRSWGDFGGVKSRAAIENDVYDALLFGYVPSIGDHLHPRYGIDKGLYADVKEIYEDVMALEPWTDDSVVRTDTAILRNKISASNFRRITPSDTGAARMLSELKVSYDIINEDMDFSQYKLLVLPDNIAITDKLAEKLEKFDGSILSTGNSIRKGGVWDYISDFSADDNTHGFYRYGDEVRAMYSCAIKMQSDYGITDSIEAYFKHIFDGIHSYFYVPDSTVVNGCAAAIKDNKAHISFNIFEAYMEYGPIFHKELVKQILDKIHPDRVTYEGTLPSTSRVSLASGKNGDVLHVKVTYPEHRGQIGVVEEHNVLIGGKRAVVGGEYAHVYALPEKTEIKSETKDGKTYITLPEIIGYKAFLLEI